MSARTHHFKPLPLVAPGIETDTFWLIEIGGGKFRLKSKLSGEGLETDSKKVDAMLEEFFNREF